MISSRSIGRVLVASFATCGAAALLAACGSNGGTGGGSQSAAGTSSTPAPRTTTATTTVTPSSSAVPSITPSRSASASATPSSSAAPAASDPCPDGSVKVTADRGMGATGHLGFILHLRNESGRTCTLHGYPGLDALGGGGSPVLAHAKRTLSGFTGGSQQGEPVVKLHDGESASARVESETVPTGSAKACKAAAEIAVTPPNTKKATILMHPLPICDLQVHPVVPGGSGNLS